MDGEPTPLTPLARVLGIGELLWDVFPDRRRLGGAPFNVTASLRRLGHPSAFVTAVGDDELGREAVAAAGTLGIDTAFIGVSADLPTGTVAVIPDDRLGHRFEVGSPAAYEALGVVADAGRQIDAWGPAATVFGTLAQRFPPTLRLTQRIASGGEPIERLYDVNLRDGTWTPGLVSQLLALATIVKANADEARVLAGMVGCVDEPGALGERLAREYRIGALCVTHGAAGAVLWMDGELTAVDGISVRAIDTVGAGDAFAAGLLHGILTGMPPADLLALANRLGALVASRPGALPDWRPDEVL